MTLQRIRTIVLVGHENEGSAKLFEKITSSFPEVEFLTVIGLGLYYKKSFLGSIVKLLREASWIFLAYRFIDLVRFRLGGETLAKKCRQRDIQIAYTHDINSPEAIDRIKRFNPDLLVSLFTMQLYKAPVLKIAKYGSITSHPSILPNYRGLEVFFWVLANNERETGVSVFFLTEKIDAGQVFEQQVIPITPEMTVASLYRKITEIGGDLLVKAVRDIDSGEIKYIKQEGRGAYYRMPDRDSVRRFLKLGRRFF